MKHDFDLPPSWVLPLEISPTGTNSRTSYNSSYLLTPSFSLSDADFESRFPRGSKIMLYRKAKSEKFAEYLNQDGLVSRLTIYNDTASQCD